MDIRRWKRRCR